MFLTMVNYIQPLEVVEHYLKEHIQFLDKYYNLNKFIFSGRRNPRVGGIILMNTVSKQEAEAIIAEDPFYIHHIARYEMIEFTPTKYAEPFQVFLNDTPNIG
ncbi:YciI family protein [Bacillus cereus group sp. BfR-BA-01380]|uniref:YciI family protein n=1 Tax=Bacillus cereus group sp. BfR-BA-01380 TaxID=2920324 RepID=UPI001F56C206|nr:YciI family protein [Bacillus cereus group sp. BfR-BA-01380]